MLWEHELVELWSKGVRSGLSIHCERHRNVTDANACAADMIFGTDALSASELELRLKRCVLRGCAIDEHADDARDQHKSIRTRKLVAPLSEEEPSAVPVGLLAVSAGC